MLELREIAHLEESRLAIALAEIADESRPWGGGVMCRTSPGNWLNCVAGAGLCGEVVRDEFPEMIAFFEERSIEPRIELAPFADHSLVSLCAEFGFVVRVYETVFFREIRPSTRAQPIQPMLPDLRIERVDVRDPVAVRAYSEVAMSGFYPAGMIPTEDEVRTTMRAASHPRSIPLLARVGDVPAGAGGMEIIEIGDAAVAALYGLSVKPEYRRRGIQQALIAARTNIAAERGATLATISSRPGVATERNVRRMGFEVAYTKTILVRPGDGLIAVRT